LKFRNKDVSKDALLFTIDQLVKASERYEILDGNRLRFGNAQKFVNLYLKCMWTCGYIKIPPHFPVDRIILSILCPGKKIRWTKMNRDTYLEIINEAEEKCVEDGYETIAEWEASKYLAVYIEA
jgi:hypothetical protein